MQLTNPSTISSTASTVPRVQLSNPLRFEAVVGVRPYVGVDFLIGQIYMLPYSRRRSNNTLVFFDNNTMALLLKGLRSGLGQSAVNDAVVSYTIVDAAGAAIPGYSEPLPLNYWQGSDGDYVAIIDDEIDVNRNEQYTIILTVDAQDGSHAEWSQPLLIDSRSSSDEPELVYKP